MTGNIKIHLYSRVLCIISLICIGDITAEEWMHTYFQAYYNFTLLPNSMSLNEAIVAEKRNATTVVSCMLFCAKKGRYSLYYNINEMTCYSNNDFDNRLIPGDPTYHDSNDDDSSEIMYGNLTSSLQVSTNATTLKYDVQPYKDNCLDLYRHGYRTNATYTVQPIEGTVQDIFCDMEMLEKILDVGVDDCLHWLQLGYIEDGVYDTRLSNGTTERVWCDQTRGGLTVIQRRQDGSVDFFRTWAEYVNGFGDAEGEYWLGLEAIYLLSQLQSSLRIDMEPFADDFPLPMYALYDDFSLTSATHKYRLSIGKYLAGRCGDSLAYNNLQQFSTWDNDNGPYPHLNCTNKFKGAWWYNGCSFSNLNGGHGTTDGGITWTTCWGVLYSAKACSMGIIRN